MSKKKASSRSPSSASSDDISDPLGRLLDGRPWITFVLPMVVYMAIGMLEPKPPSEEPVENNWWSSQVDYAHYPLVYTGKILLTVGTMFLVWPGYRKFPCRVSPLGWGVGIVGAAIWIGLCELRLEPHFFEAVGLREWYADLSQRSAFNPLEKIDNPLWSYGFLAIRLFGLVVVVAVVEEFFLRGFLMRFVQEADWWKIPIGKLTPLAAVVGTAVPMLMHPGELLAAAAWFSLITWLSTRTHNIWDCVAAHATTNLLLGVYVLSVGGDAWRLL